MKHFVIFFSTAPDFWEYETFETWDDASKRAFFLSDKYGTEVLIYFFLGKASQEFL